MPRIAVIGCGAAGIIAIRVLTEDEGNDVVAFEKTNGIGGVWNYRGKTVNETTPFSSPMYSNLRTNLPYEVMPYLDKPFPPTTDDLHFITHQQVFHYLDNYAKEHDVYKYIQFGTSVQLVEYLDDQSQSPWRVTVQNVTETNDNGNRVELFDYVVVCNGHYELPEMPKLPGMELFQGRIMHSVFYDHPEEFTDQRVVLLGAAASGQDIALDLHPHAAHVYLAHRRATPLTFPLPANVTQKTTVVGFEAPNVVCFQDGSRAEGVDMFIYCTGYQYWFPFLHESCGVQLNKGHVEPLYLHCVNVRHPTMFFVGLCRMVCPFPLFHLQVKLLQRFIREGGPHRILPSTEEMLDSLEEDKRLCLVKGLPLKQILVLNEAQWDYDRKLAALAGCPTVESKVERLYEDVRRLRVRHFEAFRKAKIEDNGTEFVVTLQDMDEQSSA